jgi:hypothetical protein
MMPSFTDFFALVGIDLVLSAVVLRVLSWGGDAKARTRAAWLAAALFAALWWPLGEAKLPALAYVRGLSSDLSITLVALACLGLWHGVVKEHEPDRSFIKRETGIVFVVAAAAGLFLYPLALGLGDWDAYRLGWGTPALWLVLLMMTVVARLRKFRLLPLLLALAMLGWAAGLLESTNLWDYLLDPWLFVLSLVYCIKAAFRQATEGFAWPRRDKLSRRSA